MDEGEGHVKIGLKTGGVLPQTRNVWSHPRSWKRGRKILRTFRGSTALPTFSDFWLAKL